MFSRSGTGQRKQLEEKEQILIQASLLFEHEAVAQSKNAIFSARTDLELPNSSVIQQIHSRGAVPDVMNPIKETDIRFDSWFRPYLRGRNQVNSNEDAHESWKQGLAHPNMIESESRAGGEH